MISSHRGFSLVEVVISMMMLGMMILVISGFFSTSFTNNFKAKEVMNATIEATDIMENIKEQFSTLKGSEESAITLTTKANEIIKDKDYCNVSIIKKDEIPGIYGIEISITSSKGKILEKIYSEIYIDR